MFALFIRSRSTVESLQLKLNPNYSRGVINPLFNDAVARSLRELRTDMLYKSFELPGSLYLYPQLETLILEKLSFVDIPSKVYLIGVKKLHLLSVRFSSDESVTKLLSICPLLEDLAVRRSLYTNVMIFNIDVPTLKSLSIDNSSGKSRPEGVHGFVINAPSLTCFNIKDTFSNYLRFGNMPELVKASVNIVCDQPEDILGSLATTRYLSLRFQSLYFPLATSFLFLDHLELYSFPSKWCYLLKDTPILRVLKLSITSVDILHLKLNPSFSGTDINPLVNDAVARSLRELRIDMLYISFELPESLYVYPQLETLILEKLSLVDIPSNASLIGVKKLKLLSVRFSSDESVIKLLSICPLLEDLVVRRSLYTKVMIFTIDVPTLKTLYIDDSYGKSRPEGVHGFVINAPSLRCFNIKGSFSNYLRFGNMAELVKASVNIVCDQPEDILGSLVSTRYLSLCLQSPYLSLATSFLFLDHLELYSYPSQWCSLLKDAPKL
ncbi:hypothetical protein Bca52824_026115 [Brassica carinata]|uniref:Uncharacterized protein n=1 Tax=Brassica carinata TaxID=52824 RepID=A0A8X7SHG6_BRACI|nr:hypothetical protein Bca52824_026115 [Brassica carinata]